MIMTNQISFKKRIPIHIILAILVGTFWYLVIGKGSLNPINISWTFTHKDLAQHFLGWEFFRNEPFTFPLGKIQNYGFPFGTSLAFTDSIPLAGIFFKLFNPLLPDDFQYFGIWLLACFILQAYFSIMILRKVTTNLAVLALGTSLLLLSPPLLFRAYVHISLTSHWLILWGIYLVLEGRESQGKITWQWPVLFFCASAVHLYFVPMTLLLFCVYLINAKLNDYSYRELLFELGLNLIVIFAANMIIGNFILNGEDLNIGGLGIYSMNLNALFDPLIYSRFLKELPKATEGQYEGFNYLGMGNIILLVWSILLVVKNYSQIRLRKRDITIISACFIFSLIALSNQITFWNHTLVVIDLPGFIDKIYGIARGTGRFFWPVFYFLINNMLILTINKIRARLAIVLLIIIVVVQFVDISPLIRNIQARTTFTWETPLQNEFWGKVPAYFSHVIIYPADYLLVINNYEPIAHMAATNHLKLNAGFMARWPVEATSQYAEAKFRKAIKGNIKPNLLFVIMDPNAITRIQSEKLVVLNIDGYTIMFSRNSPLLQSWPDWQNYEVQTDQ